MFTSNMTPFQGDTSVLVDNSSIPAPEVESASIIRGTGGGATCDALGFLSVQIKWPRGSDYDLDQVGFEYRVVSGEVPEGLLPEGVVVSPASGRKAEHQFTWQDLPPDQQRPIRLVLEVRAVTPDRQRGVPAHFVVGQ
jgi:hypothetical protein